MKHRPIPRDEMRLARLLADIHILWEPGPSRTLMIREAIDDCATRWRYKHR